MNIAAGPARAPGSAAGLAAIGGWQKMQDTYALLGTVAVAFCNRVGNEEGLTFWGGSRLIGPDGATVVEAPLYEEALVIGTLDTDDLRMQRYQASRCWRTSGSSSCDASSTASSPTRADLPRSTTAGG